MNECNRVVATLRVVGDSLVPEEVSKLLGAEPTKAFAKGDAVPRAPGRPPLKQVTGMWRLESEATEPGDLDRHVADLLGRLTTELEVWSDLGSRFQLDLFCGWFMEGWNEVMTISPGTMLELAKRGIMLSLDVYGQDRQEKGELPGPPQRAPR